MCRPPKASVASQHILVYEDDLKKKKVVQWFSFYRKPYTNEQRKDACIVQIIKVTALII